MAIKSMADKVREVIIKRAFVPGGDMAGGMPPPGMDPSMAGGMPPPGMDPFVMGDPMAGMPPPGMDPSMMGAPMAQSGMINMTADEFTKFIKQMMAAFGNNAAPAAPTPQQQTSPDIGAKLDTLIAVLQGKSGV